MFDLGPGKLFSWLAVAQLPVQPLAAMLFDHLVGMELCRRHGLWRSDLDAGGPRLLRHDGHE